MNIYRLHRSARGAGDYTGAMLAGALPNTPEILSFGDLNHIASCQAAGFSWVGAGNQLAIQVPLIVIPEEFNILLNPNHTGYHDLAWSEVRVFRFDPRLFLTEPQTL